MSRELVSVLSDALDDAQISVFWACDLLFDSPNQLYFWNGVGDLSLDGNIYTGAGELIGVSEMQESSDIAAYGAKLTLTGIPKYLVSTALSEPYQGRHAKVKFGINAEGVYTAVTVFSGEMDQMGIQYGAETVTISLDVESRLIDLDRSRVRRYTHEDQKKRFVDDRAFEFVTRLQDESLQWGS